MLRVKVCGITRAEDALAACALGADAIGFIFYERSPRYIAPEHAAAIGAQLPSHVSRVGVFVTGDAQQISQTADRAGLDAIQLHGDQSPALLQQLEDFIRIKVFRMREGAANSIAAFSAHAEAFLLDTYDRRQPGGTGRAFDWSAASRFAQTRPVILAGGLAAGNVAEAVRRAHPYAVDLNSGVEARPGIKDHDRLRAAFHQLCEFRREWQPAAQKFPLA